MEIYIYSNCKVALKQNNPIWKFALFTINQIQGHSNFWRLVSRKGVTFGHMSAIKYQWAITYGSLTAPSNLTLSDIDWSKPRSIRFGVVGDLYNIINAYYCHAVLLIWTSHKMPILCTIMLYFTFCMQRYMLYHTWVSLTKRGGTWLYIHTSR